MTTTKKMLQKATGTITDETDPDAKDAVYIEIVDNVNIMDEGQTSHFPIRITDAEGKLVEAKEDLTVTIEYLPNLWKGSWR